MYVNALTNEITPSISYRDERTQRSFKQATNIIPFQDLYQITGIQLQEFNTVFQLYDDIHNLNRIKSKNYRFMMISDYIAYVLTGERHVELTNLSTTGLFDDNSKCLARDVMSKFDIPQDIFPQISKPGDFVGYLKKGIASKQIPVIDVCTHDTASAIIGMPMLGDSAFISSGSMSLVGAELPKPINSLEALQNNFTNEMGYKNTINFLKNTSGMFVIDEIINGWSSENKTMDISNDEFYINQAPNYEGFADLDDPIFFQPRNMLAKLHQYLRETNQSIPIFYGQVFDCIYQSLALKYAKIIEQLIEVINKPISSIVISGGGSKAKVLNQYVANATNMPVYVGPTEAASLGNAIIQFIAKGEIKDVKQAREIIVNTTKYVRYDPKDLESWQRKKRLYQNVLETRKKARGN